MVLDAFLSSSSLSFFFLLLLFTLVHKVGFREEHPGDCDYHDENEPSLPERLSLIERSTFDCAQLQEEVKHGGENGGSLRSVGREIGEPFENDEE